MININVDELKLLIISRGLTIDKVADLLCISRKTIYNKMYSKNKRFGFTVDEIKKLSKILNVDVSMFIEEDKQNEFTGKSEKENQTD